VEDFSPEAMAAIRAYDWPGNVRELMYSLERAVLFADGPVLHAHHLTLQPPTGKGDVAIELPSAGTTIQIDFADACPQLDEVEYQIILAALKYSSHNLSRASRILGISRDAIRYRLEKYQRKTDAS
jgi:DNA-binding NtrC family response regulator